MQVGTGQRKGAAFPLSPIPWGDCMRIKLKGLLCGCTVSGIVFYALAAMAGASAVVDMVYADHTTALMTQARDRGLAAAGLVWISFFRGINSSMKWVE